jgi:arylsulfatase A-like enzyme
LKVPLIWASTKTLDLPEPENTTPRQIDIAPTILATQEIQIPEIWQGRKIQERSREELFFHEYGIASLRRGKDCQAVYGSLLGYQESKFHSCTADENGVQKREFFALDEDPFEQNNIWESLSAEEKGVLMQTLRSGARN